MEEQRVRFTKDLDSKGVFTHIADTVTIGDTSYAHPSTRISSGFSDENGKMLSTFAMLQKLTARINQLEEAVRRTKGELTVRLFIGQREYPITNGAELDILIEMEDYAKRTQIGTSANPITVNNRRTYLNEVYTMKDMYLLIENSAKENPLGLLSTRTYSSANTASSTPFALVQGDTQAEAQGNWVNDDDTILFNPQTEVTPPTPPTNPPTPPPANETIAAKQIRLGVYTPLKTQFDNQWIWLQAVKPGGTPIYYDGHALIRDRELEQFIPNDAFIHSAVVSDQDHNGGLGGNFGIYSDTKYGKMDSNNAIRINRPSAWKTDNVGSQIGGGSFAASIHPKIQSKNTIIETNTDKVHSIAPGKQGELNIPLNLYWKPNTTHLPFSGTFPMISNITESTYYTVLTVDSTAGIEAGDEIILTGIINTANNQLSSINNVPIVVLGASGSDITIDIGSGGQTLTATTNSITAIGKLAYQGSQNQGVDTITYRGNTGTSLMAESIFRVTSSNAIPQERKRSIRMYMEPENSARPFQFMINFTLRQFKPVSFQSSNN